MQAVPINNQTWLICGGRDFVDFEMFRAAMSDLLALKGCPSKVVQGGAGGADTMAREWAIRLSIPCVEMAADWKKHGKAAGPIRNQEMLDRHAPQFVVAFPGGRGTADMVSRSRKAGIDVAEIKPRCRVCGRPADTQDCERDDCGVMVAEFRS
jgi:hypothetical protein